MLRLHDSTHAPAPTNGARWSHRKQLLFAVYSTHAQLEGSRSQLRVAYLVSQYPAVSHTFILREIRELRRLGMDIRVASIRTPDRPEAQMSSDEKDEAGRTFYVKQAGIARIVLDHLSVFITQPFRYTTGILYAIRTARLDLRKIIPHLAYFAEAVVVGCWMRREKATHLHTHFSSTVALFLGTVFPVSISMTIHGSDEFKDSVGFLLPEKIERSLFVCAISSYGRSQLARVSPPQNWDKLEVVPLGVDLTRFAPRPFRAAPDPLEVVCVGRLASPKAHVILIEAIRRLRQQGRSIMLRLVGDGPDRKMLEQQVATANLAGQVVFEGALNFDAVLSIYSHSDIFALSSFAEGVPVVLMEAMAIEIACVATWVTGVPELIRNEVDGLLVPPADVDALAAAIARLQDDPALRKRLGEAGRLRVAEKYDLMANVRRLAAVFSSRLDSK